MNGLVRRLGGFTTSTLLTALATIASIPLLVRAAGPSGWSDLVVGQSLGTFIAVFCAWGWAVTGPSSVAACPPEGRLRLLRQSLRARALLTVPALGLVMLVVPLVVTRNSAAAVLSASAMVLGSLGGTWYFIGSGDSKRLLLLDTVPRAAGVLLGAVIVAAGAPLIVAPLVQLAGAAAAVIGAAMHAGRPSRTERSTPLLQLLSSQSAGVTTSAASALYVAMPLMLVTQLSPSAVPAFALADRLLRYGVLAAVPISGFAQSWVPADSGRVAARIRIARRFALAWGVAGGVVYALLGPVAGQLLTSGVVQMPFPLVLGYACAAGCILASQIVGLAVLLALDDARALAVSTIGGLACACALIPLGLLLSGGVGAAAGLALSEAAVLVFQLIRSIRRSRGRDIAEASLNPEGRTAASEVVAG